MSLTRNDIQILKEAFKPEFDRIYQRFNEIDQRFEKIDNRFNKLESYFDQKFAENERAHDQIVTEIIAQLYEMYTPREDFNGLEERVTSIEEKIHQPQ